MPREGSATEYVLLSVLGVSAVCLLSWVVSRHSLQREAEIRARALAVVPTEARPDEDESATATTP